MKSLTLSLSLLFLLISSIGFSQWSTDPENPGLVCDLTGIQNNVRSFADDDGGAFVFWLDTRSNPGYSPREIYGQHYDSDGYELWEADGRLVMAHYNSIISFDVQRNSNGTMMLGMITQALGSGAGDTLSFQMLDYTGESLWTDPLVVANAASEPNYILYITSFKLLPVESEFYVLYEPTYYGGSNGTRYTRFDSNGNLLGAYDGVPVGNQTYIGKSGCSAANDGSGDFFLYHTTGNGSGAGLLAYRFTNAGGTVWGPVDVVQNTTGLSYQFEAVKDDTGITFVWQGMGSVSIDLFARRLTLDGEFDWGGTTVNICPAAGNQENFHLKQKDMYIYVTWADGRPGVDPGYFDIYAQKMDNSGYLHWMPDGIEIASFNTYIPYPMLEILDDYSIIVDHQSNVAGFMAQKVNADGSLPWGPAAVQISTTTFNPFYQMHLVFQSGENTIATWNKAASGGGSDGVYITKIDAFTGVKEEGNNDGFTIFPNPADDIVEITTPENTPVESVTLFNVTGQMIETGEFSSSVAGMTVQFNLHGLPAGIYFVRVLGENKMGAKKLIVR